MVSKLDADITADALPRTPAERRADPDAETPAELVRLAAAWQRATGGIEALTGSAGGDR